MAGTIKARGTCDRCSGKWREEYARGRQVAVVCSDCGVSAPAVYIDARGFRDRTGNVGRIYTDDSDRPLIFPVADRLLEAIRADYDRNPKGFVVAKWSRRQRKGYFLEDAGKRWIEYLRETRSKTYADHQEIFLRHVQARIGNVDVREIRAGAVEDLYRSLLSYRDGGASRHAVGNGEKSYGGEMWGVPLATHTAGDPAAAIGFKPKSTQSILFALRTLLNWMKRREELERVPAFPEVKVPTRIIRWITRPEQERVVAAAPERYRLPFRILIETGIRPGEVVALAAGDIQEGGIVVCKALDERGRVKETKAGRIQFKRVSEALFADLQAAARGKLPGAPLFVQRDGKPVLVGVLSMAWRKAARKAGVNAPLYEGTRHSFATRLRQEKEATMGRELAKEMGHGRVSTTMKFYAPKMERGEE